MRGKTIVYMLIAVLLATPMLSLVAAAPVTNAKMFIDPAFVAGHPEGEDNTFTISIKVVNAKTVYGWGIDIGIAPLERVITPTAYAEGMFLKAGGTTYWVRPTYDKTNGIIHLGATLLGVSPGVSGDGTLATIDFMVLAAGECAIELLNTKLVDNNGELLPHNAFDGYYKGPTLNLVNKELSQADPSVGQTLTFSSKVKNLADVDLYARTRFDLVRGDGRLEMLYSGQMYQTIAPPAEYFYINEYFPWICEWTLVGDAPYLDAVGDGNYIYHDGSVGPEYIVWFPVCGQFGFEDIDLAGRTILRVELQAYMKGAYLDYDNDIDTYGITPTEPTAWLGSLWGTADYAWRTVRWTEDNVFPEIFPSVGTEEGFNALRVRYFMYWTADDLSHGPIWVDAVRLMVEYSPVSPLDGPWTIVPAGEIVDMPILTWSLLPGDEGRYKGTCHAEYRYFPPPPPDFAVIIQRSRKTSTFTLVIKP